MKKTKLEKFVRRWDFISYSLALLGAITSLLILWIIVVDVANGQPIAWNVIRVFSTPFIISLIAAAFYAVSSTFSIFKGE